jgi:hypothetical protein
LLQRKRSVTSYYEDNEAASKKYNSMNFSSGGAFPGYNNKRPTDEKSLKKSEFNMESMRDLITSIEENMI